MQVPGETWGGCWLAAGAVACMPPACTRCIHVFRGAKPLCCTGSRSMQAVVTPMSTPAWLDMAAAHACSACCCCMLGAAHWALPAGAASERGAVLGHAMHVGPLLLMVWRCWPALLPHVHALGLPPCMLHCCWLVPEGPECCCTCRSTPSACRAMPLTATEHKPWHEQ